MKDGVRIEPYAVVQPGSRLEAGAQLKAVRKSRSKLVPETKDPLAMLKQLGQRTAAKSKKAARASQDLHRWNGRPTSPMHVPRPSKICTLFDQIAVAQLM